MKSTLNNLSLFFPSLLLLIVLGSCTIVSGNGKMTQKTINTASYSGIEVDGSMDVELVAGEEGEIIVEAEENIIEFVVVSVQDGILLIDTKDGVGFSTSKGIKVTVPVKEISQINLDGSGDIKSNFTLQEEDFKAALNGSGNLDLDLEAKSTTIVLDGSGNISLKGKAEVLNCELDGSGNVNTLEFKANETIAELDGSGNMNVYAANKLNAELDGSGNIQYKGDPTEVKLNNDGTGNISKL